jgi:hypothetical protein
MWHYQYAGVRCVCCLPVGLLVRSHGGRGANALGFRRISTSSERSGRLAHQAVVSGRLRTPAAPAAPDAPATPATPASSQVSDLRSQDASQMSDLGRKMGHTSCLKRRTAIFKRLKFLARNLAPAAWRSGAEGPDEHEGDRAQGGRSLEARGEAKTGRATRRGFGAGCTL